MPLSAHLSRLGDQQSPSGDLGDRGNPVRCKTLLRTDGDLASQVSELATVSHRSWWVNKATQDSSCRLLVLGFRAHRRSKCLPPGGGESPATRKAPQVRAAKAPRVCRPTVEHQPPVADVSGAIGPAGSLPHAVTGQSLLIRQHAGNAPEGPPCLCTERRTVSPR